MAAPKSDDERKANRRGAARLSAVQALYQMDIAGTGLNDILAEFESHWIGREVEGEQYLPAEAAFFRDVVSGVVREQRSLDPLVDKALAEGWPLKRIETVLRAVLRAGAYELGHRSYVPARVVVSEYVDVAHAFLEGDETGMVNAVLDQLARQLRAAEFERETHRVAEDNQPLVLQQLNEIYGDLYRTYSPGMNVPPSADVVCCCE